MAVIAADAPMQRLVRRIEPENAVSGLLGTLLEMVSKNAGIAAGPVASCQDNDLHKTLLAVEKGRRMWLSL